MFVAQHLVFTLRCAAALCPYVNLASRYRLLKVAFNIYEFYHTGLSGAQHVVFFFFLPDVKS